MPVGSKARKAIPLPAGDKIELTLKQTIELTLQNVLDLDVAAYNLEESHFGILSARGAFDPNFEARPRPAGTRRSPRQLDLPGLRDEDRVREPLS